MTKRHLTHAQLLQEWRLRSFPEPVNDPIAGITREDGVDLDALIEARMADWYAKLLNYAPLELQAPVDMADSMEAMETTPEGGRRYRLPDGFKRLVYLLLEGESRGATILAGVAARLYDPRRRLFDDTPVALLDEASVTVYPDLPLRAAVMVCDTDDGLYHFDSAALSNIEPWI